MNAANYEKKIELVLFCVLFFSFAYFYQGSGANQNARFDQIRSIVELGQLNLKPFAGSHDIVQFEGKTYPNKAPGVSLIGVIPYYLVSRLRPLLVRWFSEDAYHLFSCYVVTVIIVGLACALGGVVFFRLLGLLHPSLTPRLICTFGLFLGTPVFAYSTMLYGHMPSTVLTICSFYLLYKYMVLKPGSSRSSLFIFLAGLSGGGAVVTEYPTVLIVSVLSLYCLIVSFRLSGQWFSRLGLFLSGVLAPAVVLLGYNYLVFHNPFHVAYFDKRAAAHGGYREGFLIGLLFRRRETIKALYQTSFGPFRGFFHLSPFLILIFPGIFYFAREKGKRSLLAVLWILVIGYFLINSTYHYWYGGKALGPRHAMEILPYLCILTFFFVVRFPRISALLVVFSIFLMLTAVSVRPESYEPHPFRNFYFYDFFSGNLSLNRETTFQRNTVVSSSFNAFNLGEIAGLKGQFSLLLLYITWLIGGLIMGILGQKYGVSSNGRGQGAPAAAWVKFGVLGLLAILVVQVINLAYQLQIKAYLEDLTDAGTFRVSPVEAPPSEVQTRTSPGHRTQVWEVQKPFLPGDTVKIEIQHAAAGSDGGFYIVAFGDRDGDGSPDVELGRSPFLTAKKTADWSYWTLSAPEGKLFVGNTWNEGARVFFERLAWRSPDFSSTMFYSGDGMPILSTSPRSTNMAVEIVKEE